MQPWPMTETVASVSEPSVHRQRRSLDRAISALLSRYRRFRPPKRPVPRLGGPKFPTCNVHIEVRCMQPPSDHRLSPGSVLHRTHGLTEVAAELSTKIGAPEVNVCNATRLRRKCIGPNGIPPRLDLVYRDYFPLRHPPYASTQAPPRTLPRHRQRPREHKRT